MESLGVEITGEGDSGILVRGRGLNGLAAPSGPIDCGNSATTARLLAGVVAGRGFSVKLAGDETLSVRPMERIAVPLSRMNARVSGRTTSSRTTLPLIVGGDEPLLGAHHRLSMASAQVKSCLLLAGLRARGETAVTEPRVSRNHTENMLRAQGVELYGHGRTVMLRGPARRLEPLDLELPGDASSAAFMLVAALLLTGSVVDIDGVGLNPTRLGFVDALRRMGGEIEGEVLSECAGEAAGCLRAVGGAPLRGTDVLADETPRLLDEIPVLAVAAALARGRTRFLGCGELRYKESDRIAVVVEMLRAFGVHVKEYSDGFDVTGTAGEPLEGGGRVESKGDHRIAMAAVVLALTARKPTTVCDSAVIANSYPALFDALARLHDGSVVCEEG